MAYESTPPHGGRVKTRSASISAPTSGSLETILNPPSSNGTPEIGYQRRRPATRTQSARITGARSVSFETILIFKASFCSFHRFDFPSIFFIAPTAKLFIFRVPFRWSFALFHVLFLSLNFCSVFFTSFYQTDFAVFAPIKYSLLRLRKRCKKWRKKLAKVHYAIVLCEVYAMMLIIDSLTNWILSIEYLEQRWGQENIQQ